MSGRAFEFEAITDAGTERGVNQDCCATLLESETRGLVVVADGVSSHEAGDTASQTAVSTLLETYRQQAAAKSPAKRLYRAVQRANIAVFDLATVVPELRGMATTLTAVAIDGSRLSTVHVGDSRLYLIRAGRIQQLTKDHTVAAERARFRLLAKELARNHPDRFTLTRSLGRELIASVDQITTQTQQGDVLVACSDGLYNVIDDEQIASTVRDRDAPTACRALIDAANQRGTPDNVTAAVIRILAATTAEIRRVTPFAAMLRWIARR